MTIYKKTILDIASGEITKVEFTPEELAVYQEEQAKELAELESQTTEQATKEATRQAALDKLAALGLTPEEIAAITGA